MATQNLPESEDEEDETDEIQGRESRTCMTLLHLPPWCETLWSYLLRGCLGMFDDVSG